MNLKGSGLDLI